MDENNSKKRKSEHIEEYDDIKKKKIDNEINKLDLNIQNCILNDISKITEINDTLQDINLINVDKFNTNINIISDIFKENKITYYSLIILSNLVVNDIGKEKYINGEYSDIRVQNIIFNQYICLTLYPSYLFQPYIFDDDIKYNYVDFRDPNLSAICSESKYLFPTWKKINNYNIDYRFENTNQFLQKICKNFTKKIFNFYEKLYGIYFNIVIGNMLSFVLLNYEINLNPFDVKFNKSKCEEWICGYNQVILNCEKFIRNYATIIELDKIDELNKDDLIHKINKIKKSFIININNINNDDGVKILFKPLEKFYKPTNNNTNFMPFIETDSFDNIIGEIEYIFKVKTHLNLIKNCNRVKKYCY
jgi:hypothetical protein